MSRSATPDLRDYRLVYLATPYSKFEGGLAVAFEQACRLTARLIVRGARVYSPIAHTHPVAIHGGINPLDHSLWIAFDEAMMEAADCLCVAKMSGYDQSHGIAHEIEFFRSRSRAILYVDPITLALD